MPFAPINLLELLLDLVVWGVFFGAPLWIFAAFAFVQAKRNGR